MNRNEDTIILKQSCIERFAPAVLAINELISRTPKEPILIAIDGMCASGKSTLGYYLKKQFDANLFHMDDFFLQLHQRTPERLSEIGGNVDYERFQTEVIKPILHRQNVLYRIFDCKALDIIETKQIPFKRINLIEGSYSQHPYFSNPYDLKLFMEIDTELQLENIRKRNGEEKLSVFKERWIPKEEAYFETFQIKEKSDLVIKWNIQ